MKFFFILFSLAAHIYAVAQQADTLNVKLDEVLISGLHKNDSLLLAPAAVGILNTADFSGNNTTNIAQVVNQVSGVLMQSGALNTNRITIRGIGARTPFGTNKIRAFFGAIPLTSGDSETTIEDLNLENMGQAEIIKGPLSSLYGAGLGGAILLSPRKPRSEVLIASAHGSFGLVKNNLNAGYAADNANVSINYHSLNLDGWRQNSAYRREGTTIFGNIYASSNTKIYLLGNHTYLKAFIPSSIDASTFEDDPRAAAPTWNAAKGYEQYRSWFAGIGYETDLGAIKSATSVFSSAKQSDEPRPFDILRQDTKSYGLRTQFTMLLERLWAKPEFIAGAEYFNDALDGSTFENNYQDNNGQGSLQGARLSQTEQRRNFWNIFSQFRLSFRKIEIQAGINYNTTTFKLQDEFPASIGQEFSYDGIWSPRIALLFKITANKTLYASFSRGFSLPGISETLTPDGSFNQSITPETGYNVEAGAKAYFLNRMLYAELSMYHMRIKDLLIAQRISDDQYIGANAGETLHVGAELSIKSQFVISGDWSFRGFFSGSVGKYEFLDFEDRGNNFSGNELTGVPSTKMNLGLTFQYQQIYLTADALAVNRFPMDDANTQYNAGYSLLNLKAGYRISLSDNIRAHFSAGVNNVANTHYASMVLVNATALGANQPRYYYPGLPVNYYVSTSVVYAF